MNFFLGFVLDHGEESVLGQLCLEHRLDQLFIAIRTSGCLMDSHDESLVEELRLSFESPLTNKIVVLVYQHVLRAAKRRGRIELRVGHVGLWHVEMGKSG